VKVHQPNWLVVPCVECKGELERARGCSSSSSSLPLPLSLSLFPYFPLSPPLLRRRRLFLLPLSSGYHCHEEDDDCDANGCDGESFAIRTTYEYDIV
jgi:hypothetical protein